MASLETGYRRQKAVLWTVSGRDYHNEVSVSSPVEIMVRWSNKREEFLKEDGTVVTVDANVVVDRDIDEGSLMWLGALDDWRGTGSNDSDIELMQVVGLKKVPGLKGRRIRRVVMVMRFKGTVPE